MTKDDEECALCGHVRKEHIQARFRNAMAMNFGIRWMARLSGDRAGRNRKEKGAVREERWERI